LRSRRALPNSLKNPIVASFRRRDGALHTRSRAPSFYYLGT
jgi:hypothetical protein